MPGDLHDAIDDLNAAAEDIKRTNFKNALNPIERMLFLLDSEPLASLLTISLPKVDFVAWFETVNQTIRNSVGSGRLLWPKETSERVSMQLALLRAIVKSEPINLTTLLVEFFYSGNNLNLSYSYFIEQLFQPFLRDLGRVLNKAAGPIKETEKEKTDIVKESPDPRKVFVVHGRNQAAKDAMLVFLRSLGLQPIEWTEATSMATGGSPYIGSIIDVAFSKAQAIVVLLTGDDEARLRKKFLINSEPTFETDLTPQARPNVLFEAGRAFGSHPDRTILVELGQLRPFSDISGMHIVRLQNATEKRQDLAMRLRKAGCSVNMDGTAWHTAGNFDGAI